MATTKSTKGKKILYLGADHRGFKLKERIKQVLITENISFMDCGDINYQAQDDYPDYAKKVAEKVGSSKGKAKGLLICGSAEGVCITANKFKGVRAAIVQKEEQTKLAVQHDHANIICLPASTITPGKAKQLIRTFLKSKPSKAARHIRRINKIKKIERQNFK